MRCFAVETVFGGHTVLQLGERRRPAGLGELITPAPQPVDGKFPCPQDVTLDFDGDTASACPAFAGRVIRGVKNGESPAWLKDTLRAIGLRPINALVDITNFLSYDRARPLHVYDADKLKGTIGARLGKAGETFLALDGREYTIDETMCVIADETGALGLGGVMGGETTGCTEETTSVFIESAYFDPLRTAKTGRKTGITSDARYRFERGVDPAFMVPGLEQATQMVIDLCGGEPSDIVIAGNVPAPDKSVSFPPQEVRRLTGVDVPESDISRILQDLGFGVETSGDSWTVRVPTWRPDIGGKADLVEEVIRIVGFDQLPTETLPTENAVSVGTPTLSQIRRATARRTLAARGLNEAVTWSFSDEQSAALFCDGEDWLRASGLVLANPISVDLSVMRPSLLPNLLSALGKNADRGSGDLALFEVAPAFHSDRPEGQIAMASGARRSDPQRHWGASVQADSVFTAKADAFAVLEACGANTAQVQITSEAPAWYHPGRSGLVKLGPKITLAAFGEIHPRVLKTMDLDGVYFGFEVNLDAIPAPRSKASKTRPALTASDLMPLKRDFAFIVDRDVPAMKLLKAVQGAEKNLIAHVGLFDVYEGTGIPDGKKSLALEVTLQPSKDTLTDEDIEKISSKITDAASKATGAALRQ
ncbi:MAG: phenylalanine--tRNA ligase subunit beta [Pseudomonadota bacterium]